MLLLMLTACAGQDALPADAVVSKTEEPVVREEEPVIVPETPHVYSTPVPVPTATPVPTDTPEPTPTPSPTPIPVDTDLEAKKRAALMLDTDHLDFVSTRGDYPTLLKAPAAGADRIYPFRRSKKVFKYEWIVLEPPQDGYYHVRAVGADAEGYFSKNYCRETQLEQPENTYALMVRARGLVYCGRLDDAAIVAHADYAPVRVFGMDDKYACVVTDEGKTGFAELGQLQFVDRETFEYYIHQSCETPESSFDRDDLADLGREWIGEPCANAAEFVYNLLYSTGLHFNEVYYRFYQKPLDQEKLYPNRLYRDAVYNTLLFKLFNSSGMHVTCNGEETEWAFIQSYEDIEPGDLLFFSNTDGKGDPVVKDVEVVLHGVYSGDVTDCGIYVGEDRMLTVRNGMVVEIAIDQIAQHTFDSARRIYAQVIDEKEHFIECMISMIYDRLGTPYSNARRLGDSAYDCSGIINWVLRAYDYDETKIPSVEPIDITAQKFSSLQTLYSPTRTMHFADTGITERAAFGSFERGDLILLLNESRNKVGHIMIYLGNNTVIHSTRIKGIYQGTLVAKFRNHLQNLYRNSIRIESITPA